MNSRRKRERREKRQTSYQQAAQPAATRPAPMRQSRNAMRVANAMRQIAVDLPAAIELRGSIRKTALRLDQGDAQRSEHRPSRVAKAAPPVSKPSKVETVARDQPKMSKPDMGVKCRPDGRKSSGAGSGKSREFVPWKDKC